MRRLPLAAAAFGAATAHPLYTASVRAVLGRNVRALMAGDPGPLLKMYASDAELEFPGDHTWGPVYRGRAEIEGFLRRFLAAGLRGEIKDVFVAGPPWATRIAILFDDWAYDGATKVYENRSVIVLRTRFGKVVRERVYEDTQKVAAFDEVLGAVAVPA
ncbi:MAG TPA: nuclear transport factor 2 family protein [Baekduia sp.]